MIDIKPLNPAGLLPATDAVFAAAAPKVRSIARTLPPGSAAPVYTVQGKYTSRGWTEWTQGFQYGSALLAYDATGDRELLELGRTLTVERMAPHVTHMGVHDHGFNNVSTYGALLRLMNEGKIEENAWERRFYELALKASGAVQAARWTRLPEGLGYIYSFNGPHSLFADTIRSLRSLVVAHQLGHDLQGERDRRYDLLDRSLRHAETTARYNVYFGEGRDHYDVRGRVVHESIFNLNDGSYRNPSSQQGYSPFTTWTRGQAWILLGYAEQLEYWLSRDDDGVPAEDGSPFGSREEVIRRYRETAVAVADHYLLETPPDGIPYWDDGAPGLTHLGDYRNRPADPFNPHEPVDSSAAAIAAQGLVRLGRTLKGTGDAEAGERYFQAGLTVAARLMEEPYLSTDPGRQGLLLHSVYHRPNGWDYVPDGRSVPSGESCMWGDYHLLELALTIRRLGTGEAYYRFFL